MKKADREMKNLLLKFGTSTLAPSGNLDQEIFDLIAMLVMQVEKLGIKVTIVTSGATLAGKEDVQGCDKNIAGIGKRCLAGIGSSLLYEMWRSAFKKKHKCLLGQLLVSDANLKSIKGRQDIQFMISSYYAIGATPIVNWNDAVDGREIKSWEKGGSENDSLSEKLAGIIGADAVLFLTNKKGVFEQNPDAEPGARCYKEIDVATAEKLAKESVSSSENGTGGISAKLRAAIKCYSRGMKVCIASLADDAILKFARGEKVGTMFGSSVSFW